MKTMPSGALLTRAFLWSGAILYGIVCGGIVASAASPQQKQIIANSGLLTGAILGRIARVKQALVRGADPNQYDAHGNTPLGYAAEGTNTAIVKMLLAHGGNPTLRQYAGVTPLIEAANHPYRNPSDTKNVLSVFRLLLSHGAKVNAQDNRGMTALIDASYWGNAAAVQLLLQNGAKASLQNKHGNTALKMAQGRLKREQSSARQQQLEAVVKVLRQAEDKNSLKSQN